MLNDLIFFAGHQLAHPVGHQLLRPADQQLRLPVSRVDCRSSLQLNRVEATLRKEFLRQDLTTDQTFARQKSFYRHQNLRRHDLTTDERHIRHRRASKVDWQNRQLKIESRGNAFSKLCF